MTRTSQVAQVIYKGPQALESIAPAQDILHVWWESMFLLLFDAVVNNANVVDPVLDS